MTRDYNLNQFTTMDSGTVTFDADTSTFDQGSILGEENQTFTTSMFIKAGEYNRVRFMVWLDQGQASQQSLFVDVNLTDGSFGSIFQPQGGIDSYTVDTVPFGNGWYRVYATLTFSFGFSTLRTRIRMRDENNAISFNGNGTSGIYVWGAKLNKGVFDAYTAVGGEIFFSNSEYNIKNFALECKYSYI